MNWSMPNTGMFRGNAGGNGASTASDNGNGSTRTFSPLPLLNCQPYAKSNTMVPSFNLVWSMPGAFGSSQPTSTTGPPGRFPSGNGNVLGAGDVESGLGHVPPVSQPGRGGYSALP